MTSTEDVEQTRQREQWVDTLRVVLITGVIVVHTATGYVTDFAGYYYDNDPESFCMLMGWIKGLGVACPVSLSRRMRVLSRVTGLENALRLRAAYRSYIRQQSLRLRPNRSTYSRQ